MRLIVGLGNPGKKYEDTRHNAGFWLVDRVAHASRATLRHESRFRGEAAKITASGGDLWLLKPDTFMNESGRAVSALAGFYKLDPADVLVVHDEVDLPPGAARLKFGGGIAGHNGLRSIVAGLGTQQFWRLRLGVGHPRENASSEQAVADFVLHAPPRAEREAIEAAIDRVMALWPLVAAGDMEAAMLKLHTKEPKGPQ